MNCPVCEKPMVAEDFGGVQVDACRDGCKGIWFDWLELVRLDENHEGFGISAGWQVISFSEGQKQREI